MSVHDELIALAEQCENGRGSDWNLDKAISNALREELGDCADNEVLAFTDSLDDARSLLPEGFWWRGGTCCVSSEAIVCPDHNGPHGERLHRECPPTVEIWNSGIEVELRPGSDNALCRAFAAACLRARAALLLAKGERG